MTEPRTPLDAALDLLVYAPVGLALTAAEEVPKLAAKGRQRVIGQVAMARMLGEYAVNQGWKQVEQRLASPAPSPAATSGGPGAPRAPAGPAPGPRTPGAPAGPAPGPRTPGAAAGPAPAPTAPAAPAGPAPTAASSAHPASSGSGVPASPEAPGRPASPTHAAFPAPPAPAPAHAAFPAPPAPAPAPSPTPVVEPAPPITHVEVEPESNQTDRESATPDGAAAPSADRLAIPGYDSLSASQVVQRLAGLSAEELQAVGAYEDATRRRRTILTRVRQLQES